MRPDACMLCGHTGHTTRHCRWSSAVMSPEPSHEFCARRGTERHGLPVEVPPISPWMYEEEDE